MYRIKESVNEEIVVENSRFIANFIPLENLEAVKEYLSSIKEKYPKASHYCYAYIYDEYMKSSDDGEPSGTAGRPLLEFLMKQQLERTLLIVVRYFGGVKLGASNLLRTYVASSVAAFKKATLLKNYHCNLYQFEFDYNLLDIIKRFFKENDAIIKEISYGEKVILEVYLKASKIEEVIKLVNGKIAIVDQGATNLYLEIN